MSINYSSIATELVEWYVQHKRVLPWRATKNPYLIWVSEIILQQTTVRQGLPYYLKFIDRFPNIGALATTPEDDLLKLWEGLGYYSRARNMHHAAKLIYTKYGGQFPDNYDDIRALKGVGDYTAAAVASIAYELPYPVVDGNVIRVVSRLLNISDPVDTRPVLNQIQVACKKLIKDQQPSVFNQAIMELGALVCTPKNPNCTECPIKNHCSARALDTVSAIPFKSKKLKKKSRYFQYFKIESDEKIVLQKRIGKDIWRGLYQFPMIELDKATFQQKPRRLPLSLSPQLIKEDSAKAYKQTLTHQLIFAQFYKVYAELKDLPNEYILVNKEALSSYAFPKVIDLYLNDKSIPLF
ncbi:MAG: A/G-specific adenine glycosylase [Saprospiraceae bacterium]|nr:A/G-specific adenine glycosylase [Saprospiraceae bacterium]